jgi:hypothetical protein
VEDLSVSPILQVYSEEKGVDQMRFLRGSVIEIIGQNQMTHSNFDWNFSPCWRPLTIENAREDNYTL